MSRNNQTIEQYQSQVQEMDIDIDELEVMVNDWLYYAQVSANSLRINKQAINLAELVKEQITKLTPLYASICINSELQPIALSADEKLLSRALENLIINACKFAQTKVKVSLIKQQESVIIKVEDDGGGISLALQEQIMRPFVKLDSSRNSEGVGLGLTIVKTILDKHQAKLSLQQGELTGACFVIELKCEPDF
ncbi:MAG: GHKL domain-containing protein [Psychromonas sp.]|nr:GHKL domain-containing protein [Psychromonas sp.]